MSIFITNTVTEQAVRVASRSNFHHRDTPFRYVVFVLEEEYGEGTHHQQNETAPWWARKYILVPARELLEKAVDGWDVEKRRPVTVVS